MKKKTTKRRKTLRTNGKSLRANGKTSHRKYDIYGDVEKIRDAFTKTRNDIKGKAGQVLSRSLAGVRKQSAYTQDSVANYIIDHPYKTLGTTALVGFVVGYLSHK